jgi:RNA-directed DNA polymerase
MLAELSTSPRPAVATTWHEIPWAKCRRAVGKLQVRIAKAVKVGHWRAVYRLQRLLARSFSAKCLAVLRVSENRGHKTPGVDRVTWNTPEAKFDAVSALGKRDYRPQPLRRIYIPKKNGKKRPLRGIEDGSPGNGDWQAQPSHSRLGELPPPRDEQPDLQRDGYLDLGTRVALVLSAAPEKEPPLDCQPLLRPRGDAELGLPGEQTGGQG